MICDGLQEAMKFACILRVPAGFWGYNAGIRFGPSGQSMKFKHSCVHCVNGQCHSSKKICGRAAH
eukprot:2873518-Amphidinium_carterae.1